MNEKYTYVEVSRVNLGLDVILDNGVITAINVKTEGGLEIGSHKLSDYMVSEIGDKIEQLNNGERLNLRPASGYRFALDTVTHTIVCVVDAKDEKYTVVSNLVTDSKVFKAYSYHELINASTINSRITGIEVYIVGKSKYFKNRQSFKEFLSKRKIKVTDSITEYTEYLITNENKDDDSIDDFKKETVKIIDEEYAIKLALFAF